MAALPYPHLCLHTISLSEGSFLQSSLHPPDITFLLGRDSVPLVWESDGAGFTCAPVVSKASLFLGKAHVLEMVIKTYICIP